AIRPHSFHGDRTLSVVTEVLREEVVAAIDGLAMTGEKENEDVARPYLLRELGEDAIEIVTGDLGIEYLGDLDPLVEPTACPPQRLADGTGIRRRIVQPQPAIPIIVDSNRERVEARRGLRALASPFHLDPCRLGGDQALFVIGDDLDTVVAGVERQCATKRNR